MQCGKVENEIHFIVECDNYIENRNKLYDCAEKINAKNLNILAKTINFFS